MLKLDRDHRLLRPLQTQTLTEAQLLERADLQRLIIASADVFFNEMGEKLLLVGEEIHPSEFVGDRIDLLALDGDGNAVVIELKRADQKLQLLQALSYAAMLSDWSADKFVEAFSNFSRQTTTEAGDVIRDHTQQTADNNINQINAGQRVILIAEDFDYALLKTAEWLTDVYGVDIKCYRFSYARDEQSEYLSCACIYPPPELVDQALRSRRSKSISSGPVFNNWDEALKNTTAVIADFFKSEIQRGVENRVKHRDILYRIEGTRRFGVAVRSKHVYAWQIGRFPNDIEFWRSRLSEPDTVQMVTSINGLSFSLVSSSDLAAFKKAVSGEVKGSVFDAAQ